MDEETKLFIQNSIEHAFRKQDENLRLGFKKVYEDIAGLKEQVSINCTKLDNFEVKLDNMPLKIKQELLPQLITEVRNCVRDEITVL